MVDPFLAVMSADMLLTIKAVDIHHYHLLLLQLGIVLYYRMQ